MNIQRGGSGREIHKCTLGKRSVPKPPPSNPRLPQPNAPSTPRDDKVNLSTNIVYILQRVKKIREMLDITSLKDAKIFSND
jgi:hypothetical protein